jgi:ferredoxin
VSFTVSIDPERCQGHGQCLLHCPQVFDADDHGYAVVAINPVPAELRAQVERSAAACPESAITIRS